jgi:hypothetical protein
MLSFLYCNGATTTTFGIRISGFVEGDYLLSVRTESNHPNLTRVADMAPFQVILQKNTKNFTTIFAIRKFYDGSIFPKIFVNFCKELNFFLVFL